MAAIPRVEKRGNASRVAPDCLNEGEVATSGIERLIRVTKEARKDGFLDRLKTHRCTLALPTAREMRTRAETKKVCL